MPDLPDNSLVLGGLAAAAVGLVGVAMFYSFLTRNKGKFRPVGVVSKIFVHPIKSCKGLEVSQAECVALGIQSNGVLDRSFLIINEKCRFINRTVQPTLALVAPALSADGQSLLVDAPGMPTLSIPLEDRPGTSYNVRMFDLEMEGVDCGSTVNEWFCEYLGKPGLRLIRYSERLGGKALNDDPTWGTKSQKHEHAVFQNFSQITILGEASLDNLNSRLDKPVQIENFRPNIVVTGSPAFSEDRWKYVQIGEDVAMRVTHQCGRCRLTTVDPNTGTFIQNGDPLKTLKGYRMAPPGDPDKNRFGKAPLFCINAAVEKPGGFKMGDVICASE